VPTKTLVPCRHAGCPALTVSGYCPSHQPSVAQRPSAAERGYDARWHKARKQYLRDHPVCVRCGNLATDVDHVIPHRGDLNLFWDQGNWQALCGLCHRQKTAREDGAFGNPRGIGA